MEERKETLSRLLKQRAEQREYRQWFKSIERPILKALLPLNGKRGLRVEKAKPDMYQNYGEIARVYRRDELLGIVCIGKHRYTFRGSDESPEQEGTETRIWFTTAPNVMDYQDQVNQFTASTAEEFLDSMAHHLAR